MCSLQVRHTGSERLRFMKGTQDSQISLLLRSPSLRVAPSLSLRSMAPTQRHLPCHLRDGTEIRASFLFASTYLELMVILSSPSLELALRLHEMACCCQLALVRMAPFHLLDISLINLERQWLCLEPFLSLVPPRSTFQTLPMRYLRWMPKAILRVLELL